MFHILLHEPEIPGNTGNIIRLCANTGAQLHLIGRLGFTLDEAPLRRAGLDYHDLTSVHRHADLAACVAVLKPARLVLVETGTTRRLGDLAIAPGECLLFGSESRGVSVDQAAAGGVPVEHVALPMRPSNRSLNLSNAVAVTVFEAWRQNGYAGADEPAHVTRTPP